VSGVKVPGPWMLTWEGQLPVLQPHCLACAACRGVLGSCTLITQGAYCRSMPGAAPSLNHTAFQDENFWISELGENQYVLQRILSCEK